SRYLKARKIIQELRATGQAAYFVGGWVRDYVTAGRRVRRVGGDIDIATSAEPGRILSLYPESLTIGEKFGVMMVQLSGETFEISTFRVEGAYSDGRHPDEVSYGDVRDDARRRDFTVNALYFDPMDHKVLDYSDGLGDIAAGLIRAVGDPEARFAEDKLRLMRAVRLAVQLGFRIETGTLAALESQAAGIKAISHERVRDELSKILVGPDPAGGIELLHGTGLLEHIIPETAALSDIPQSEEFHPEGDALAHTVKTLAMLDHPTAEGRLELFLGALLHDVGKAATITRTAERIRFPEHDRVGGEEARRTLTRLRYPKRVIEQVVSLVTDHMRFKDFEGMKKSTRTRLLGRSDFPLHLELHRADCLASHGDLGIYESARKAHEEYLNAPPSPEPLLRGRDLLEMGYSPGPSFGRVLQEVEDARLEGKVRTKSGACGLARRRLGPPSKTERKKDPEPGRDS
ncbi:CCA tRNA nucleotidyltransferase, partial [candidate division KSB1 bacterium]